ncbi:hypothetical protein STEG23_003843, partial [Scotinomys teguina]
MEVSTALQEVLKTLIHDGLACGICQTDLCVFESNSDEHMYVKLVEALCAEQQINLIRVNDNRKLGEWAGFSLQPSSSHLFLFACPAYTSCLAIGQSAFYLSTNQSSTFNIQSDITHQIHFSDMTGVIDKLTDNKATMSLLNCENSCGSSQSSSDCCAAMATSCSAAMKDDSVGGSTSTGNLSSSFMEEIQGYDVEFDPPLESKYECPICLMALREAVQTPCGHRFCKACIIKSIRDAGHKCPVDNEILLENQLFPDNFAKREILSLTVKCPNKGCLQKMELRHLEDHQAHCEFALMNCPQCQRPFQKCQFNIHIIEDCPRRLVSCVNCAVSMPFEEKEIHDQSCPLANIICEYCGTILIREQ